MRKALCFLLNLHHGEEKRALLFLALGLTWGIGCYGSLALGEGLFLEELGTASLPSVYLGSAFVLCLISSLILYSLSKNRAHPKALFLLPLTSVLICNLYLLWLLLTHQSIPRVPLTLYRILIWSLTILSYTNFWGFVDQFFNLQDAKRHFGMFNAIIFLGDFFGAGIVNHIQVIGVETILILFIAFLLIAYPLVHYVSISLKDLSEDHELFLDSGYPPTFGKTLFLCLKDRYTFYLLTCYFLMQLLAVATEFNYLRIFEELFANASRFELTAHITKYSSWISLGNMCFALFVYSRVVKTMGVNNIILLAPFCFFSLFLGWSFNSSLMIATLGMIAREGLTYALDDNNLQLLIYGVPNKIRNQIRITIESFIEPIGMFVWAVVCFFLTNQYTLCMVISAVSILLAFMLKARYASAILRNLSSETIQLKKNIFDWLNTMTAKEKRHAELILLTHLKHQNEKHQAFAFRHLLSLGSRSVLPNLLSHMNKLSVSGKLKTLDMLKNSLWAKDFLTLELLKRWSSTSAHPAIAAAVHQYFAEHNLLRIPDIAEDLYVGSGDRLLAAILTVKKQESSGRYRELAEMRLKELLHSTSTDEVVMGLKILTLEKNPENFTLILEFLDTAEERIFTEACKAICASIKDFHKIHGKQLLTALKQHLHNKEACQCLLHSLFVILEPTLLKDLINAIVILPSNCRKNAESMLSSLSKDFAPFLLRILLDISLHNCSRMLAAKALCQIDYMLLNKHAYKILKAKASRALFFEYHKNYIQKRYPKYNLSLLVETLALNHQSEVNFMLEFLGILGSVEHSDILIRALMGKNLKAKAQALESLEKNCDSYLFSLLTPFITKPEKRAEKYYLKSGVISLTLKELLNMMENSPSHLSKLATQQLKSELAKCDSDFYSPQHYPVQEDSLHGNHLLTSLKDS